MRLTSCEKHKWFDPFVTAGALCFATLFMLLALVCWFRIAKELEGLQETKIKTLVNDNKVVVFSKTWCPFCAQVRTDSGQINWQLLLPCQTGIGKLLLMFLHSGEGIV